jgi:hypothetical protein
MKDKKSYNHTREVKKVSLGKVKDADILKHIEANKIEFSTYVKNLIRVDMKNETTNKTASD